MEIKTEQKKAGKLDSFKKFFGKLGPGLITGAADDDPSGIATYSQTGAQFGYSQLWTALFTAPFMTFVQEMCAKIGLVTGSGLAGVIRKNYSKKILYFSITLLLVANTINIGADLGAMAASLQLVFGMPILLWLLLITLITLLLEIFVSYKKYAKILKWLCFTLLVYIVTSLIIKQDWSKVAYSTLVPNFKFDKNYIFNIVAILGTTISPYLFFWQASEEVEEEIAKDEIKDDGIGKPRVTLEEIKDTRVDTAVGMVYSQIIMFFIILTAASTLYVNGVSNIQTPQDAALALKPFAGDFAYILFTLGIIGTGLLSIPVLAASSSYAISETFGFKSGLSKKFNDAPFFYIVIIFSTLVGFILNFVGINPMQALYFTAVANGILAPPLLIVIMFVCNNKKILGKYTNSLSSNIFGWIITVIMSVAAVALIVSSFL